MSAENQFEAIRLYEALVTDASRIAKSAKTLSDVVKRLAKPEGYSNLNALAKNLDQLNALSLDVGDVREQAVAATTPARIWLEDEWARRAAEFAQELAFALSERSIPSQTVGKEVTASPFVFFLDPQRDHAQLTYAGEPIGKARPLSVDLLYRAFVGALEQLKRNETSPEEFADEIIDAYRDACAWRKPTYREGGKVRLSDVHFALFIRRQKAQTRIDPRAGRVKEYPRYQFAWDISLLREQPGWLDRPGGRIALLDASAPRRTSRTESVCLAEIQDDGSPVMIGDMQVLGR
jgi:hypothetical protein